jgi:hypothetical protein
LLRYSCWFNFSNRYIRRYFSQQKPMLILFSKKKNKECFSVAT